MSAYPAKRRCFSCLEEREMCCRCVSEQFLLKTRQLLILLQTRSSLGKVCWGCVCQGVLGVPGECREGNKEWKQKRFWLFWWQLKWSSKVLLFHDWNTYKGCHINMWWEGVCELQLLDPQNQKHKTKKAELVIDFACTVFFFFPFFFSVFWEWKAGLK